MCKAAGSSSCQHQSHGGAILSDGVQTGRHLCHGDGVGFGIDTFSIIIVVLRKNWPEKEAGQRQGKDFFHDLVKD